MVAVPHVKAFRTHVTLGVDNQSGLMAGGPTVILSTHDADHAIAIATFMAQLHRGGIRAADPFMRL